MIATIFFSSCSMVQEKAGAIENATGTVFYIPLVKYGDYKINYDDPPDPDNFLNTQDVVDQWDCFCPCSCEDYYKGLTDWSSCIIKP